MSSTSAGRIFAILATFTLVLGAKGECRAVVLDPGTNIDLLASNPMNVGQSLVAFTLTAAGKNGAIPTTFDSTKSGQGGTGITTLGAAMHQIWEFNVAATPTTTLIVPGGIPLELDTHFLVDSLAIASIVPPQENRTAINPLEHPFAGLGNALWGAFSLPGQSQAAWNFAYVVVPLGATVQFDFQLAAPGFAAETIAAQWTLVFAQGDVNYDGLVDIADVLFVGANWLETTRDGDANGDGIVDIADILVIGADWTAGGGGGTAVPEPGGLFLAAVAMVLSWLVRGFRAAVRHSHSAVQVSTRWRERLLAMRYLGNARLSRCRFKHLCNRLRNATTDSCTVRS